MALIATAVGVSAYVEGKRREVARNERESMGTTAGSMLAIYALANIKPIYGGLAAAAWLVSEAMLPTPGSMFGPSAYKPTQSHVGAEPPPRLPAPPGWVPIQAVWSQGDSCPDGWRRHSG